MNDLLQAALVGLARRIACMEALLGRARSFERLRQKADDIAAFLQAAECRAQSALALLPAPQDLLDDLARQYNGIAREVYLVEQLVVGPLSRFSSEDEKLSSLSERICKEVGIADIPIVLAASSQYYSAIPEYGLIFTPPIDSQTLLNLPDLYHELAHHLDGRGRVLVGPRFESALESYVDRAEDEIARLSRPIDLRDFRHRIAFWQDWRLEVASDAFATLLVGPAYAWANLHLMLRVPSIFRYSESHPADAARMDFILRLLRSNTHFNSDVESIERKWRAYQDLSHPAKPDLYDLLHPSELFTAVLDDVRAAIESRDLRVAPLAPGTVAALLNEAWRKLLERSPDYAAWEAEAVASTFA